MAGRLALVLAVVLSISVVTGHKGKCCNRAAKLKRKKIVFKRELSECKADAAAAETVAEEAAAEETVPDSSSSDSASDSAPCSDNEFDDWYPWKYLVDAEGQFADAEQVGSPTSGQVNCEWFETHREQCETHRFHNGEHPSDLCCACGGGTVAEEASFCDTGKGATWNADTMKCEAKCEVDEARVDGATYSSCAKVEVYAEEWCDAAKGATWNAARKRCEATNPACACAEGAYLKPGTTDTCLEVTEVVNAAKKETCASAGGTCTHAAGSTRTNRAACPT